MIQSIKVLQVLKFTCSQEIESDVIIYTKIADVVNAVWVSISFIMTPFFSYKIICLYFFCIKNKSWLHKRHLETK